ncbi:SMC-Scp complex subunit ScpB [Metabacillus iocasae]|uniref:Segregation and condensation protein B n=1 Tax=Priestia iocasae TaxID=2291674 RepID=A0ABS2QQE4_9BACI|nr:SMC-Scp complex subunit ScpB [Metabacillus iocasae]MBM7701672.1 segregation and condensation protein B [Metabacillus iocasae]
MSKRNWKAVIEGLLFVAGDEGLSIKQLKDTLEIDEEEIQATLRELQSMYENEDRGVNISEIANVYQLTTKKEISDYVKKLMDEPINQSLSQAALETLAIVAYRQPITRAEIEEIRGVKTERPLQTLVGKALVKEVGRAEGAGRAILYGTTKEFLNHFGLKTIDDLPPLPQDLAVENNEQEADLFFQNFQA